MKKTVTFISLILLIFGCQSPNSSSTKKTKEQYTFNHVKAIEISSNNVDEQVIEDRYCKTIIGIEDGFIEVSGYTDKKTYFEIISTNTMLGANVYTVETNQKESSFIFDNKEGTIVWQLTRNNNSGLQVYFTKN